MIKFLEQRLARNFSSNCNFQESICLKLQSGTLCLLQAGKWCEIASLSALEACYDFSSFNPDPVELKHKQTQTYPFPGITQYIELDLEKLLAESGTASDLGSCEREIFLCIDEQFAGNTLLRLNVSADSACSLNCLDLSSASHASLWDFNLERNAALHFSHLALPQVTYMPDADIRTAKIQACTAIANLEQDAALKINSCNFTASSRQDIYVHLNQKGAAAEVYAAQFAKDADVKSNHIEIRHHAPHTTSFMESNGVIADKGKGEFVGRGYIDKGANGANCRQESRFLTLDGTAKADTYPLLIIDEYDVEAGHATSVGQLNPDALYYLQSRGLSVNVAKQLMTRGFLVPIVDRFNNPLLHEIALNLLDERTDNL